MKGLRKLWQRNGDKMTDLERVTRERDSIIAEICGTTCPKDRLIYDQEHCYGVANGDMTCKECWHDWARQIVREEEKQDV